MPSSDQAKTQPVVKPQAPGEEPGKAPSQACAAAAAGLEDALQRIAGQIGDANRRHCDALADMQERLGQLARQVEQVRAGRPEQHTGALTRLEQEIAGLSQRSAAVGRERHSQTVTSGPAPAEAPAAADEPWDAQSAEALTRVYEMAQAEDAAGRQPRRGRAPGNLRRPVQTAPTSPHAPSPAYDQAWLEARFAGIAALLQQSLSDSDPAKSLAALDRRFDRLEGRLDSLLNDVSVRLGGDWLKLIEEHIKELAAHFEATSRQLGRLDAVDEQLRQLARALEEQRQWSRAQPAGLRDDAIAALIDTAAERAATRLASNMPAAMPAPEAGGGTRIDALEGLMQDYIAERRRGEETTTGMLHTIEDALVRIMDRVEAMEAASLAPYPPADGDTLDQDGMGAESERLAEAYAAGARILGQKPSEPALDAADYAQPVAGQGKGLEPAAAADTQTRQELRASAMRAKLKAQTAPEEPAPASPASDEPAGRAKISARAGGPRSGLLLASAMALLFGAGYLIVDRFLEHGPVPAMLQKSAAPTPEGRPAADLAQPKTQPGIGDPQPETQTGKSDVVPPGNDRKAEPVPVPQPAQRPPPRDVTDDERPQEAAPTRRLARSQAPAGNIATGSVAEPAAVSLQAVPGMVVQADPRAALDGAAMLPPGVGTAALRSAAANGDALAQFEVGTRFAEGNGVAQDHKLAFAWYERAALRGLAPAQFRLAAYYERGVGVAADTERAKIWYRRAAEQGHVRAMHNLAVLLVGSSPDETDYAAAAPWFRQAADRGFTDSQFNLAVLYMQGHGVGRDLTEAYKWFGLAARTGDAGAARRLEEIKARLDLPEREAAEQKLADWRAMATEPAANHAGP